MTDADREVLEGVRETLRDMADDLRSVGRRLKQRGHTTASRRLVKAVMSIHGAAADVVAAVDLVTAAGDR